MIGVLSDLAAAGCAPGFEECDGICIDVQNDGEHCGSCVLSCGDGLVCIDHLGVLLHQRQIEGGARSSKSRRLTWCAEKTEA